MGAQEFNTVDVVRLEVETEPTGLVNMIPNPNGELGGWGWVTPLAGSQVSGVTGDHLSYQYTTAGASYFYSEPMTIAPGQYVAARLVLLATSPPIGINAYTRNRFEFLDAAGAVISSSAQTALVQTGTVNMSAVVAPALTAFVRLRFDMYTSGGANPAGFNAIAFNGVTVAKAATSGALQSVRENLIPNPSFETNTTGWAAYSNCGIARTSAAAAAGAWSLAVTATAAGSAEVRTLAGSSGVPVTGGVTYTVQARSRAAATARTFRVGMVWYDAAGAVISSPSSTATNSTGSFVTGSHSAAAPAGAVRAAAMVIILGCAAAEVHYVDAVMLEAASSVGSYFDSATADTGTIDYSSQNQTPVVTSVRTNHLPNPSMETNATGWTAGSNTTIARSTAQAQTGTASLALTATTGANTSASALTGTSGRPVVAGTTFRVSGYFRAATTGRSVVVLLPVYDTAGVLLGTYNGTPVNDTNGGWVRALGITIQASTILSAFPTAAFVGIRVQVTLPAVGEVHYVDALILEAYTTTPPTDAYFDGATADGTGDFSVIDRAWTGTAHASTSTETTTVTLPYSRATTSNLDYIEPVQYLNVIAESHEIRVRRNGLNVGELSATIVSAALDPADSDLIRPGRRARLTTLIAGVWETVLAGKLLEADVTYDLKNPKIPNEKRARIEVLILDATQTLANAKRPEGVATIDELPFVLEGAGVPWNVNGSGSQYFGTAGVTTYNDSAFALNQVALTRDTCLGYAWMSRLGVCNVWDASEIPSGSPLVLDESDYSDLKPSFSTKDCINEVTVVVQSLGVDGTTVETSYGPYRDAASIEEWGAFSKTFTVTGLDTTAVDALAAAVLAANGTPRVRVNSVTLPLTTLARVAEKALTDLYDQVNVTNALKAIDDTLRVTTIEHVIDTKAWMVTLAFADEGGVAMPVFQPPVQSGARPDVGVIELFAGPTGNIPPSKLLCNGASVTVADYPYLFAVIGYTFGGAGASFNLPNLTDRFPIGSGTKALGTTGGSATHTHALSDNGQAQIFTTGTATAQRRVNTAASYLTTHNTGGGPAGPTGISNTAATPLRGATDTGGDLNPWLSLNFVIRAV